MESTPSVAAPAALAHSLRAVGIGGAPFVCTCGNEHDTRTEHETHVRFENAKHSYQANRAALGLHFWLNESSLLNQSMVRATWHGGFLVARIREDGSLDLHEHEGDDDFVRDELADEIAAASVGRWSDALVAYEDDDTFEAGCERLLATCELAPSRMAAAQVSL